MSKNFCASKKLLSNRRIGTCTYVARPNNHIFVNNTFVNLFVSRILKVDLYIDTILSGRSTLVNLWNTCLDFFLFSTSFYLLRKMMLPRAGKSGRWVGETEAIYQLKPFALLTVGHLIKLVILLVECRSVPRNGDSIERCYETTLWFIGIVPSVVRTDDVVGLMTSLHSVAIRQPRLTTSFEDASCEIHRIPHLEYCFANSSHKLCWTFSHRLYCTSNK